MIHNTIIFGLFCNYCPEPPYICCIEKHKTTMRNLTICTNMINHTVELIENSVIKNGQRIAGRVIKSISYNPNRWYGTDCHSAQMLWMERQMEIYNSLSEKQYIAHTTPLWTNNKHESFPTKADAFNWMNEVTGEIDSPKLYCNGELHYTKIAGKIFDEHFQTYIAGKLPVERYD